MVLQPASRARHTYPSAMPQKKERTGIFSSRQMEIWSSQGNCRMKFTPKGLLVSWRTAASSSRKRSGGSICACNTPNPPALLTAATSSGPEMLGPIGAEMMGTSICKRLVNRVCIPAAFLFGKGLSAHSAHQGDGKTGKGSKDGHWRSRLVSQSHVRLNVAECPHHQQEQA